MLKVSTESHSDEKTSTNLDSDGRIENTNEILKTTSKNYYWIGIDYCNTYNKYFQNIEQFSIGKLSIFLAIIIPSKVLTTNPL